MGHVKAVHVRRDLPDGKTFAWERSDGQRGLGGARVADLPLYLLPQLLAAPSDSSVIVVEGERAADALRLAGFVSVGTVTGASSAPGDASLRPLLGRDVYLWPDNDNPGREHMAKIATSLARLGGATRIIAWTDAREPGDDAADFLARGGTAEGVRALLAAAPRFDEVTAEAREAPASNGTPTDAQANEDTKKRKSQATRVLEIVGPLVDLFHDTEQATYADLPVADHRETVPLASRGFRQYLAAVFYEAEGGALSRNSTDEVIATLSARAVHSSPRREVGVRVLRSADSVWIDLGDPEWHVVHLRAGGWTIEANAGEVRHWRPRTLRPLPVPRSPAATLAELAELLPGGEATRDLVMPWLVGSLLARPPYPVVVLRGPQGAGKSTLAELLRNLVDPAEPVLRGPPREERDLAVAARNSHVLAFDNVSRVPEWLSDGLCRIATGSGFATRTLYSDAEETVFGGARPVVVNGITDVLDRPDLISRAIPVVLPAMADTDRRRAAEIEERIRLRAPALLALLLDIASAALRILPDVKLESKPRMADYAHLLVAVARACQQPDDTYLAPYLRAFRDQQATNLAQDAVADAVIRLVTADRAVGRWTGTATELLAALPAPVGRVGPDWPTSAASLGNRLRRLEVDLREAGVDLSFPRSGRRREIVLQSMSGAVTAVTPSPDQDPRDTSGDGAGDGGPPRQRKAVTNGVPESARDLGPSRLPETPMTDVTAPCTTSRDERCLSVEGG